MSFTIDFTKVDDFDAFHADQDELDISYAIAWASLVTGINRITEANAAECHTRFNVATEVFGGLLYRYNGETDEREKVYLPLSAFQRRIGLHTNTSPRTKQSFNAEVIKEVRRQAQTRG